MTDDEKKPGKEPDTAAPNGNGNKDTIQEALGSSDARKDTNATGTATGEQSPKVDTKPAQANKTAAAGAAGPAVGAPPSAAKPPPDKAVDKQADKSGAGKSSKSQPDAGKPDPQAKGGGNGSGGSPPTKPGPERSGGNRAGILALVLVILLTAGVLAGGWWLWQQQQNLQRMQADVASSSELEELRDTAVSRAERLAGRVDNLAEEHQAHVQDLARTQAAMDDLRGSHDRIASRMQRLEELAAAHRQDWILSEVDYLFGIAEQRVRFRRDVDGALAALRDADNLLSRLGAETVDQRQQIRRAVDALLDVRQPDRTAMAAELGNLIESVDDWGIEQPEQQISPEPMPGQPDADLSSAEGWRQAGSRAWQQFKNSLASLVVVRRDEPAPPLISPEESWFLRENIRLQLQTARLALLEAEPETFQDSLEQASAWLDRYFQKDDPAVQNAREALQRFADAQIEPELPNLGELLPRIDRQQEGGDA